MMTVRPLRDQIIIRPLHWQPSKVIQVAGNKRSTLRGVVVAVGPGQRVLKYWRNTQGQRIKAGETGQVIPTEVKPGDVVELGGLEIDGYKFQTVYLDGHQHVICQEQDVAGIVESHDPDGSYLGWTPRQWACAARLLNLTKAQASGIALHKVRNGFKGEPESDRPNWLFHLWMGDALAGLYSGKASAAG